MKLPKITIRQFDDKLPEKELTISVFYDNGKDYPYKKMGVHVTVIPVQWNDKAHTCYQTTL